MANKACVVQKKEKNKLKKKNKKKNKPHFKTDIFSSRKKC